MEQAVSDKPREFWIDSVGDTVDGEFDAIVCDKEPPHIAIHVIEFAAFEKLKAENERLMRERDSYAGYAKLNDELMEERDTLKAKLAALDRDHADDWKRIQDAERKLAEVEAEATSLKDQLAWSIKNENMYKAETHTALINLERMREQLSDCGALYEGAKDTFKELNREREAARVMREALLHIKDVQETLGGESVLLDDVNEALAKADEILERDKING